MSIVITDRAFPCDPTSLLPAVTPDNRLWWDGIAAGELHAQRCTGCNRLRYPIVPVCPWCHGTKFDWKKLSGKGQVYSWVRYHRSYLPEFEDLMPYIVITAQLDEGVRMYGRLANTIARDETIAIGAPVEAVIERWPDGRCVPAFRLAGRK